MIIDEQLRLGKNGTLFYLLVRFWVWLWYNMRYCDATIHEKLGNGGDAYIN